MEEITTKELSGIQEQLNSEKTLIRKLHHYAECTADNNLKAKYLNMASKHQAHFDTLYSLLG